MQNSRRFCFYNPVALSSRKLKSRSSGNQIPHLSYLYLSFRALFMILITCSTCMVDCISNDYWAGKPSCLSLNENNAGVLWKSAAWAMNIDEVRSVKIDLAPTIKRHHTEGQADITLDRFKQRCSHCLHKAHVNPKLPRTVLSCVVKTPGGKEQQVNK